MAAPKRRALQAASQLRSYQLAGLDWLLCFRYKAQSQGNGMSVPSLSWE